MGRRISIEFGRIMGAGLLLCLSGLVAAASEPGSTADHSKFPALQTEFESGPAVTKACLECHTEAAKQVQGTIHWTWEYHHPETDQILGKRHVINSFCGNVASNEPRCTSCHAGYGWRDDSFDFTDETKVDCLVCHDNTGTYAKYPTDAGHPLYEPRESGGTVHEPPDLVKIAQSVGPPGRANCGACHFYGGGGDGVKHGDLDSSLVSPDHALDVHMDTEGLNFACSECHSSEAHRWSGSRYNVKAVDPEGTGLPGLRRRVATCESCHGTDPHPKDRLAGMTLNDHVDRVACQTCHIPSFARENPTKTWWDWSQAGRLDQDGKPIAETDSDGNVIYLSEKGEFRWEKDVVPAYAWFDGQMRYTLQSDEIDPEGIVEINHFNGSADDPKSRIWPFKAMRGRQPYDKEYRTLVYTNVFGNPDTAYWEAFDWSKAITAGMATANRPFSGEYGFVDTVMYWPTTHMVAPANSALACDECHAREGRMAGIAGVYLPGRDRSPWLDWIGTAALLLSVAGVAGHAALRLLTARRRRQP